MDKLEKLKKQVEELAKKSVKAGVLEGSRYDNGKSVAEVAMYNEFGTAFIPARPFFRITDKRSRKDWSSLFAKLVKRGIQSGEIDADKTYEKIGRAMQSSLMETIQTSVPPPNSPETIARKLKKGANPVTLIDTGTLIRSIDFEVIND